MIVKGYCSGGKTPDHPKDEAARLMRILADQAEHDMIHDFSRME